VLLLLRLDVLDPLFVVVVVVVACEIAVMLLWQSGCGVPGGFR
jgi:hypothetical protein